MVTNFCLLSVFLITFSTNFQSLFCGSVDNLASFQELLKISDTAVKTSGIFDGVVQNPFNGQIKTPLSRGITATVAKIGTYNPVKKSEKITLTGKVIYFGDDNVYNLNTKNVMSET